MKTVIWSYIKQYKRSMIIMVVLVLLLFAVLWLYQLPAEALKYAALLCTCVLLVYVVVEFILYYRKHKQLNLVKKEVIYQINALPKPENLIEQDYTDMVELLFEEKNRAVSKADAEKKETIEYYTLWAHQIKTPIAGMRLMLQGNDSEEHTQLLNELFRIEQYVEMVLSYLRLDSDYSDLVIKHYDLDAIIKQAVRKYATLFIRKKIRLDLQPINERVLTDEKWLGFVIEQLLSNALKYTKNGTITIYMEAPKTLVIQDTGIGIAPEDLPRIFQKGFTGYNGRKDKKASGIGLYLCKRIMKKLSHRIYITSKLNEGTKVCLDLYTEPMRVE